MKFQPLNPDFMKSRRYRSGRWRTNLITQLTDLTSLLKLTRTNDSKDEIPMHAYLSCSINMIIKLLNALLRKTRVAGHTARLA